MAKPVVVGVDGSAESARAVRWAATEARFRGAPLLAVHAWVWPLYRVQLDAPPGAPPGAGLRAQADRILEEAAETAREAAAGLEVETQLLTGDPGARLVGLSRDAGLVVVGHRGLGPFAEVMLGSTGAAVTHHAHCPVVVVRGTERPRGPVAVGVESAERSASVVRLALQEAAHRGVALLAVHSYTVPLRSESPHVGYHDVVQASEETALAEVQQALEVARKDFPDVPVQITLGEHPPAKQLVQASQAAGLIVVGARGAGGFAELLLGSTARALTHHADCPVMIQRSAGPP